MILCSLRRLGPVKSKVFTVAEANERKAKEEKQRLLMVRAFMEKSSIIEEVAQLKALFHNHYREKAPSQINQGVFISKKYFPKA